jgi:heme/copper-type cytochrome/quinol oxidase subunit 2
MAKMSVLAGIGLAMAIAGFVYGVVAVGVPTQDPTPAQAAAERFNLALSGWAMAVGGAVMVAGIIGMAVAAARRASGRGV